jgi:NTE family protein
MDIVELIYRPEAVQGQSKDYEFSRATMERRWNQGLADARTTLASAPWLAPAAADIAVRTFDVAAETAVKTPIPKSTPLEPAQQKVGTRG